MDFVICALVMQVLMRTVLSAPVGAKSEVPYWHSPCGCNNEVVPVDPGDSDDGISTSLRTLRIQHELLMNDYLSRDYEFLYERVRIGVHEHQYVPNWLPSKRDAHSIRKLKNHKPQMIVSHLPKLHSDLQKFAVALEEMIEDERTTQRVQDALRTTESFLKMTICEVETSILTLPNVQLPGRIERDIMSEIERQPVDETRRLIRDWGVMIKYKDYLHAWRHVFDY
ncbi:hypothetical protein QAD02_023878 [Eretmocerus hayati]|uniref:Uncharacterized protein n=1 Tax=Eretmocerus hayati TaxID=131215 RepID=A0ACC2PY85_9HYME|nr:hypothetical protein QAD02_023878 [Eretmocerus hayati]